MAAESSGTVYPKSNAPEVSIIVPARNEERNLERCLRSLLAQKGVRFEMIVVDDHSTDRTREIAERFAQVKDCPVAGQNCDLLEVRVLQSRTPLPSGWTGKANACWTGAQAARGGWLLFTDADTEHMPRSLESAVREAREHNAGLLSYSPEQKLRGLAQMALMPVIFGELASYYRPGDVSDPRSPAAAANGQYLLIRRDVYERVGGHCAVASSLLDDVDLARLVKSSGTGLRFRMGRGIVSAHMYSGWEDMREGWTKNLALLFPQTKSLAIKRALEFFLGTASIVGAVISACEAHWLTMAAFSVVGAWVATNALLRILKAHFSWAASLLALLGLPVFSYLLLRSTVAHSSRQVAWKGRSYSGSATWDGSGESNQ